MTERQPAGATGDPWLGSVPANVIRFPSRPVQPLPQVVQMLDEVRESLRQNANQIQHNAEQLRQNDEQLRQNADQLRHNADRLHQIDLLLMGFQGLKCPPAPDDLTEREIEILRLVANGYTYRQIAQQIILAEGTIKNHMHHVLTKLQARNRAEAVRTARTQGII